ncbi:MAG: hypothetical protein ACE5HI_08595 [bacterium]
MSSLSTASYSIPGEYKYVLNFDLDETLFQATKEEGEGGRTPKESPESNTAVLYGAKLWKPDPCNELSCRVSAIAGEKFKELFGKIIKINRDAGETVIFVNIITNANYSEEGVVDVLKRFYGDDFIIHCYTNSVNRLTSKGGQMLQDYLESYWNQGIPPDHLYLIDDNESNCQDAQHCGFKAICASIRLESCVGGETRAQFNPEIFVELNKIIDSVREKVLATHNQ